MTTAALSRMAQTPVNTMPPTRTHRKPVKYPPFTTSRPLSSTQTSLSPSKISQPPTRYPLRPGEMTTPRPYWGQVSTTSGYRPQRTHINTTLPKSQEDKLWLGEKLEIAGEGNQVYKRPRGGGGRGQGKRRGKRLRVGTVRLVSADGLSDRGRVEIFIRGQWGTVCDDLFTTKAGTVVCRQLGFTTALAVMKRAALGEADSSVRILLDDVECEGGERSLLECKRARVGKHNCSHGEDVGVICG